DPSSLALAGDVSAAGSVELVGQLIVTGGDRAVSSGGTGGIIIGGDISADEGGRSLALTAKDGGITLEGGVQLSGGDLILDIQGPVDVADGIKVRGLVLLGKKVDYELTHPDNAVAVLAGNAGSIHFEQSDSLIIGSVG